MYNLTPEEQTELDKFLKENLEKGYLRPSQSPMASPFFFVGKKDPGLRPCQDYRYLNEHTIKNAYPLPLISELLDKLKGACRFTKLDVRWCYDFRQLRQLSTVVVSKVRNQLSLEECKSWTCIVLLGLRAKVQVEG